MIDTDQAIKQMKQNKVANVYLLLGEEMFFIEQFKKAIQLALKDQVYDEINHFDLLETPIQEVVFDAETLPFLSEHKLIFVSNPSFLLNKPKHSSIDHDISVLEDFLQKDLSTLATTIVFIAPYEKIDGRKKVGKLLNKHEVVNCHPIREFEMAKWINFFMNKYNLKIDEDASLLLRSELGANLFILENEMKKLALYVDEGEVVTVDTVLQLMSASTTTNALQLVDVVINKNLPKAVAIYSDLMKTDDNPIGLISLLAFQFRTIYQAKLLRDKNYSEEQINREMNAHPYVVKLALKRSNQFTHRQLIQMMHEFALTDERIKRGEMNMHIAFELLLYNLINSCK